jgi:hypothetical protein
MTLAIVLAAGARPAHACDPCNDGPDLATPATFGMVTAGSVGLAGLITAVGGAANPRSKGWRNANYVIGTLSLVESIALGAIASVAYDPSYPQFSQITFACAASALAIGAVDIGLAINSAVKSSRPREPRAIVVPLASRDMGGVALTGRF